MARVAVFALLLLAACDRLLCGSEQRAAAVSPDGKKTAVIYERDCGATTAEVLNVSIVDSAPIGAHAGAGNVLIADANHDPTIDEFASTVHWHDASHLEIQADERLRIFKLEKRVLGVDITLTPLKSAAARAGVAQPGPPPGANSGSSNPGDQ